MVNSRVSQILSKTPKKEDEHQINEKIYARQVRLVGNNVTMGVYPTDQALKLAQNLELDLVAISPNVDPPICKIVDYKKFLYEKKRKEKEIKSHAKHSEVKEIRFTPGTDDHDFEFKCKHAEKFLKDGDKVKAFVQFRGRSIMFQDRGQLLLLKFAERLTEFGQLENLPKIDGKKMIAIIVPKSQKKK